MPRRKDNDQDLESRDINLLPEDLRRIEEKVKKSAGQKEKPYVLRAPKKAKRKRRFFWLPIFGGPHWEVTAEEELEGARAHTPAVGEVVRHEERKEPEAVPRSREAEPGVPAEYHAFPGAPSKVSKVRKRFVFPGLGRLLRALGMLPRPSVPIPGIGPFPSRRFEGPARHYSLLEKEKAVRERAGVRVEEEAPEREKPIEVPTAEHVGYIAPRFEEVEHAPPEKAKMRLILPRWLDIFYLISLLVPKRIARKLKPKITKERAWIIRRRPSILPKAAPRPVPQEEGVTPAPSVQLPSITSIPEVVMPIPKPKRRLALKLPWWLDIFYFMSFLKPRPRKPKLPKVKPVKELEPKPIEEAVTPPQIRAREPEKVVRGAPMIAPVVPSVIAESKQPRKFQWKLPWWLDIFTLMSFLKPQPRKPKLPKLKPAIKPEQKPIAEIVTPPVHEREPEEAAPKAPEVKAPLITPVKPLVVTHAKQRRKYQWKLPWWLDIFYLLHLLKPKPKKLKPKVKPQAPFPKPVLPEVPLPPLVTPEVRKVEKIEKEAEAIKPVITPFSEPEAEEPIPPQPVITDITPPVPQPEKPSIKELEKRVTPPPPPAPEKKKEEKAVLKGRFHVPLGVPAPTPQLEGVNLIPIQFAVIRSWKRITQLVTIAALSMIGVIALLYGGLKYVEYKIVTKTTELDTQIGELRDNLLVYEKKYKPEMTVLGNRIELVQLLLDRHIYWTNFFELLEKYTLPDVYYDGLSATINGTLSLSAHGARFETVTKQLMLLQSDEAKEFVTDVSITAAQLSGSREAGEEVIFTIELTLNPNLFYYAET